MQKNSLNILSTRPLKNEMIRKAEAENIIIDCISFIETEAIKNDLLAERIRHLSTQKIIAVFTSMNAVDAVKSYLTTTPLWKIFCIGSATKNLVEETFGESSIQAVASYGSDLAEKIIEKGLKEVFFFCGNQRREELPSKLKEQNIAVEEIIVYQTINLSRTVIKTYDGILFFSPSAVNSFFSANAVGLDATLFAIGTTTADAIKQIVKNKIVIADDPGKENLVEKMIAFFNNAHKTIN